MKTFYIYILPLLCVLSNSLAQEKIHDLTIKEKADFSHEFELIEQNLVRIAGTNSEEEFTYYHKLGDLFYRYKKYNLAENNAIKALHILDKNDTINSLLAAKNYYLLSTINEKNGQSKNALKYINLAISKDNNNVNYLLHKGNILLSQQAWQSALDHYIFLEKKKISPNEKKLISSKKAYIYSKLGNREKSRKQADLIVENNPEKLQELSYELRNQLADIYRINNDFEKEIVLRKNIIASFDIPLEIKTIQQILLAETYNEIKEYNRSITILKEGIETNELEQNTSGLKKLIQLLAETYELKGDYTNALAHYKKNKNLQEKLAIEKETELEQLLTKRIELNEKQQKINIINKTKELSEKEAQLNEKELQFQKQISYGLLAIIAIVIAALIYTFLQKKKQEKTNIQLQLKNLRSQMNPHFIFNSLNAINHFITQKNELAANEYLTEFALLMRSTLEHTDREEITLSEEILFLKRYCYLEKMRFEDIFDYNIDIDPNLPLEKIKIPPLLLQPFVENAVWHGLRYLEKDGNLAITIHDETTNVKITITDNGIGRNASMKLKTSNQKKHRSKGMGMIKKRIQLVNKLFKTNTKIDISDNQPQGTIVQIIIPKT